MKSIFKFMLLFSSLCTFFTATGVHAEPINQVSGLYKAILQHEGTKFQQYANITLRTVNIGGELKIAANLRVFFGDANSNEFLSYNYNDVELNLVTRQISLSDDKNDITLVGFLKEGKLEGEWFSSMVGRVGTFLAKKDGYPQLTEGGILVQTLSGLYKGSLTNTNPESNLPEKMTVSFVTTQDYTAERPTIKITGKARFYLGEFNSLEYTEVEFEDVQFNFYNRYLTAKTNEFGLTLKGTMTHDGTYEGMVFSDGFGKVGNFKLARTAR